MIYVITAVHNRKKITETFVHLLINQTYKDIVLILVDDGSTDGTAEAVLKLMPNTVILQGDGNLWWGGALHKAYQWICKNGNQNEYVMFANDDTFFEENYIEMAISKLKEEKNCLLTGLGISKQSNKVVDGAVVFDYKTTAILRRGIGIGNCASTRSLFFRVKDYLKIGGFHPVLLPHYGSDYEWTLRASRKYGYKILCDENVIYYVNEETTGDNSYNNLNRKKLFSKRAISNPLYKFSLIFLATPIKYLPIALWNQMFRNIRKRAVFHDIMRR